MGVNTAFWRLGRARLKVALAPHTICDEAMLGAFEDTAQSEGCVLAAAFGTPFFYRQHGYAFAVPTLGGMQLRPSQAPAEMPSDYVLRPATSDDIPGILAWYDTLAAPLDLWGERTEIGLADTHIIVSQDEPVGYVRLGLSDPVTVYELVAGDVDGISAAMAFARAQAEGAGAHRISLHLPPSHPALTLAGYLGAETLPDEAFQVRVLDERLFFLAMADELATQLAGGPLAEFDGRVVMDLYARRLALVFSDGALHEVEADDSDAPWDILAPPQMAAQLWLGWRSRAELEAWHPDVRVRRGMQLVVDTLFPKLDVYIYGPPHQETGT